MDYGIIGRENELAQLKTHLDESISGAGQAVFISGEAGIGKTRLVDEFLADVEKKEIQVFRGAAAADVIHPFLIFSRALADQLERPLLREQEFVTFTEIFVINPAGLLVAKASAREKEELDGDIITDMLLAVQNFIGDSFDMSPESKTGLGRLEYGNMKILIEHGDHVFLTAVFEGSEHPGMRKILERTLKDIEMRHGQMLESWGGGESEMEPVKDTISEMAQTRFLVKKDLEGIKLDNERIRIADQLLHNLVGFAEVEPVLLLLEDLHWADESSLFVLEYLARNVGREKIMLMGTMRPGRSEALAATVERVSEAPYFSMMPLVRLGEIFVGELIGQMFPKNDFPEDFSTSLTKECEGNPFYVIEMLRQMLDDGNIVLESGKYSLTGHDFTIPKSIEEVIQKRLENLEPDAMTLAEYASCIGANFDKGVLTSLETLKDPLAVLEKLNTSGLVIAKNGSAEFTHAIIQEVIYQGVGERWKSAYHKSLGNFYETKYWNRLDDYIYELARHFSRSNEHFKAFEYCIQAGEFAENAFAAEQAVEFYETAISKIPDLRLGDRGNVEEIDLDIRIGGNLQLIGKWDRAEEVFGSAETLAIDIGNQTLIAKSKNYHGDIFRYKGDYDKALELLKDSYDIYMETGNKLGASQAMNHMGLVYWNLGEHDKTQEAYEKTLAIAEEVGDKIIMSRATNNQGLVHWARGDYDDAMKCYKRTLAIAEELDDKRSMSVTIGNLGITYYALGQYDKAMECYEKRLSMAEELNDMRGLSSVMGNMANIHYAWGDYPKALESYEKNLTISEAIGDKRGISITAGNIGNLYKILGQFERAEECYDRAIEIARNANLKYFLTGVLYYKADLYFKLSRTEDSVMLNTEALAIADEVKRHDMQYDSRVLKAKLTALEDKDAAASQLTEMFENYSMDQEIAGLNYELFKFTQNEENRSTARDLYSKLYEESPNIIFKERLEELDEI